ncbi:hypothetical protein MATL_G00187760 [Megalops atlanticus]|uniref:Vinculin n=1 Tax=Megalops atlanticus TaxID=7932 RepID=A0A9D3PMZ6_MEGAT|nr:hypothetical protein MATL_G00187760 [Megalops atlanticus]
MSSDIAVKGEHHESIATLHSKLKKAQTNTKHLAELASSAPDKPDKLEGPCILWALSIQVLLNSLDKILGAEVLSRPGQTIRYQVTPQKRLAVMSENSLRIQEAARLTSSHCKNHITVQKMTALQEEVKALTEAYLQAADDLGTVPLSGVYQLAKSEVLQRQLLIKMKVLSGIISKINKEYTDSVQNVVCLAVLAATIDSKDHERIEEAQANFERDAESLLGNVKTATQSVQDCLSYIRDPRIRANLRSINEHLSFQMSDILSRARQMVETQDIGDMPNVEIQTQYWSAEAHFLVAEIDKMEGIHSATKQVVRLNLQGRHTSKTQDTLSEFLPNQKGETHPGSAIGSSQANHPTGPKTTEQDMQSPPSPKQETRMIGRGITTSRGAPSLTYTSLFLKRETDKWDPQNNRIIQVTRDMAEKIYHMAQYLRKKGPIQSKEAFVSTAKDVVTSCKSVTQFVRVIADHCLDESCRDDLSLIVDQILTVTNQLTIISRSDVIRALFVT